MKTCVVSFHPSSGMVVGRICEGDETIKELSFYLGNLQKQQPDHAEDMIRKRYGEWARVNGVEEIRIEYITDPSAEKG